MERIDRNCATCGKSKSEGSGQSLTQWIFNSDSCRCNSKHQFVTHQDLCLTCGKARSVKRMATITQWIFHPALCSCVDTTVVASNATTSDTTGLPSSDLIRNREDGEIDYHDPADSLQTVDERQSRSSSPDQGSVEDLDATEVESSQTKRSGISFQAAIAGGACLIATIGMVSWLLLDNQGPSKPTETESAIQPENSRSLSPPRVRAPEQAWDQNTLFWQNKPWLKIGDGAFTGSMWVKDDDFKDLAKERLVTFIECPLSEDVTGEGLVHVNHFPVSSLHLTSKNLTDSGFKNIAKMKTLDFISVGSASKLTQPSFDLISAMPNLQVFRLISTRHPPAVLATLSKASTLEYLMLMDREAGNEPTDWSQLERFKQLRMLAVLNYDFSNNDLQYLTRLKNLSDLRLSLMNLEDFDVFKLKTLPLEYLDLSFNNISDETIVNLGGIKTLKVINLSGCKRVTAGGIDQLRAQLKDADIVLSTDSKNLRLQWARAAFLARAGRSRK